MEGRFSVRCLWALVSRIPQAALFSRILTVSIIRGIAFPSALWAIGFLWCRAWLRSHPVAAFQTVFLLVRLFHHSDDPSAEYRAAADPDGKSIPLRIGSWDLGANNNRGSMDVGAFPPVSFGTRDFRWVRGSHGWCF